MAASSGSAPSLQQASIRKRFEIAVRYVSDTSLVPYFPLSLSTEEQLKIYAFYKQATKGDCEGSRPGMWNVVARRKWDAHAELKGMSADEAMKGYVGMIMRIAARDLRIDKLEGKSKEIVAGFFREMEDALPAANLGASNARQSQQRQKKPVKTQQRSSKSQQRQPQQQSSSQASAADPSTTKYDALVQGLIQSDVSDLAGSTLATKIQQLRELSLNRINELEGRLAEIAKLESTGSAKAAQTEDLMGQIDSMTRNMQQRLADEQRQIGQHRQQLAGISEDFEMVAASVQQTLGRFEPGLRKQEQAAGWFRSSGSSNNSASSASEGGQTADKPSSSASAASSWLLDRRVLVPMAVGAAAVGLTALAWYSWVQRKRRQLERLR